MKQQPSWFSEHPWMTFFLAGSAITAIVDIVRGRPSHPFETKLSRSPPELPATPVPVAPPDYYATRGQYR
jgi:hypothetical protein